MKKKKKKKKKKKDSFVFQIYIYIFFFFFLTLPENFLNFLLMIMYLLFPNNKKQPYPLIPIQIISCASTKQKGFSYNL
jgi:hypothetical protein